MWTETWVAAGTCKATSALGSGSVGNRCVGGSGDLLCRPYRSIGKAQDMMRCLVDFS